MTVSLTPEFTIGAELDFLSFSNNLPDDVKDKLNEIVGFGSGLQFQVPISTRTLSQFDPFEVANYSYRLPQVNFTV